MSKTVEIQVNRQRYVQMLMAIIKMPIEALCRAFVKRVGRGRDIKINR